MARIAVLRRSLSCGCAPSAALALLLVAGVAFTPVRFIAPDARYPAERAFSGAKKVSNSTEAHPIMPATTIDQLMLADDPARWAALGFDIHDGCCQIGSVVLGFLDPQDTPGPPGIRAWSLRELVSENLDGLPTTISHKPIPQPAPVHPNGVVAIDHIVAASPELDRSVAAMQAAGLDLRRVREEPTPGGAPRQAFFRLGHEILELIQEPAEVIERAGGHDHPVRFWGLALQVEDLDRCAELLEGNISEVRKAVQPGRRIASVRRSAGLAVPLALMSAAVRGAGEQ